MMDNNEQTTNYSIGLGSDNVKLDEKNRVRIPPEYRAMLGENPVILVGPYKCLYLLTGEAYSKFRTSISKNYNTMQAAQSRYIQMNSFKVEYDAQGRTLIPKQLIKHANLNRDLVISEANGRVELWEQAELEAYWSEQLGDMKDVYASEGML